MRVDDLLPLPIFMLNGDQTNNHVAGSIFTDGLPSNIFSIGAGSSRPFSEVMI